MSFRILFIFFFLYQCTNLNSSKDKVPNFSLLDTEDHVVEFYKLMETKKLSLIFFGYSHCPNVCYNTIHKFDIISQKLDPYLLKQIEFIFISIDFKEDNRATLLSMKQKTNPFVIFLRGNEQEIEKIKKAYSVKVYPINEMPGSKKNLIHSTSIFVVDKNLNIIHKISEDINSEIITNLIQTYFQSL